MDHLGERNDLAAVIKLCGHAYILATGVIVSDGFPIAANSAVKPTEALGLQNAFFGPGVIMGRGTKMAAGDHTASFELTMARTDACWAEAYRYDPHTHEFVHRSWDAGWRGVVQEWFAQVGRVEVGREG